MRWSLLVDELAEDLRNGFRQIARNPGFTAIAVLTLALGIGANTALFSIFNSLILRPLPVRDPGSLALLTDGSWSYPIWNEIAIRETELFDGTFAWSAQRFDLSAGGQTEPVDGVRQRPALRRARRHRHPRPDAHACRRRRRLAFDAPRARVEGRTVRSLSSAIVSGSSVSPAPTTSSGASSRCSAFRSRSWA